MISAPTTPDEDTRLQALYDYDILDTEAEKVFDDLTLLASEICQTPIALISLIDPNRQWFKSKVGLSAEETHRDIAFCAHAIHERHVFEVKDTLKDERFYDNPLVTSDPNIRFYAGAQLLTPDGQAIGTLCAISDKPKSLTDKQRSALEILSREVISQLELRKKVKQLADANQRKSDYLSNISHELRTPLNAIVSFSQIMLSEFKHQQIPSKFAQYLKHLDNSGKRLMGLVNAVLDMSKIEEGKMEVSLRPVEIRPLFDSIVGMFKVTAEDKGILLDAQLDSDLPEHLLVDEAKLGQIIINLISNAIKFTPSGKQISLQLCYAKGQLIIVVRDEGVGISAPDQRLLFNKFQQVGKQKNEEGTGLGLAITKGLVDLMEGDIKLSSQIDKGTLVKVSIPSEPAEVKTRIERNKQGFIGSKDASILVVEDNQINQEVAKAVFHSIGLHIDIADSGESAISCANKKHYDVIFMDLHLPGMNGFVSAREIQKHKPDVPIIALTADVFASSAHKNEMKVMQGFLSKPIDKSKLLDVLNTFVSRG